MKVRILSTKRAPSLLRSLIGQVFNRPARPTTINRREIPYWQERGWKRNGNVYRGTYQTNYGSFIGRVEQVRPGNFRLYIFDPPPELRRHGHWTCFQPRPDGSYRIHMSRMPDDIGSGILTVERLLTEAFEN